MTCCVLPVLAAAKREKDSCEAASGVRRVGNASKSRRVFGFGVGDQRFQGMPPNREDRCDRWEDEVKSLIQKRASGLTALAGA